MDDDENVTEIESNVTDNLVNVTDMQHQILDIQQLVSLGILRRVGSDRKGRWHISAL